eukprot:1946697-Pyramimonas_sp.AAC.1
MPKREDRDLSRPATDGPRQKRKSAEIVLEKVAIAEAVVVIGTARTCVLFLFLRVDHRGADWIISRGEKAHETETCTGEWTSERWR